MPPLVCCVSVTQGTDVVGRVVGYDDVAGLAHVLVQVRGDDGGDGGDDDGGGGGDGGCDDDDDMTTMTTA